MKKKVAHITSEVAPFYKRGGLGDVLEVLPKEMSAFSNNYVICPYYKNEMHYMQSFSKTNVLIFVQGVNVDCELYQGEVSGVTYYFVGFGHSYLAAEGGQSDGNAPYSDNSNPFIYLYFAKAVLHVINKEKITDVFCHDWQSCGLFFFPESICQLGQALKTNVVIHNYGFHGDLYTNVLSYLEIESRSRFQQMHKNYGQCSLLGMGIHYADNVLTVSPSYGRELSAGKVPHARLIFVAGKKITGILNGVDDQTWSPASSPFLKTHYDSGQLHVKALYKNAFYGDKNWQHESGSSPLILFLSRLTHQKGIQLLVDPVSEEEQDVIADFERLINLGVKMIICGTPVGGHTGILHRRLLRLQEVFPDKLHYDYYYSDSKAHNYLAAADILIAPSLYEPCGLVQQYAQSFGTIPVVRAVGGLGDTVVCHREDTVNSTGFCFAEFTFSGLLEALKSALALLHNEKDQWEKLQRRCMEKEKSWRDAVLQYQQIL